MSCAAVLSHLYVTAHQPPPPHTQPDCAALAAADPLAPCSEPLCFPFFRLLPAPLLDGGAAAGADPGAAAGVAPGLTAVGGGVTPAAATSGAAAPAAAGSGGTALAAAGGIAPAAAVGSPAGAAAPEAAGTGAGGASLGKGSRDSSSGGLGAPSSTDPCATGTTPCQAQPLPPSRLTAVCTQIAPLPLPPPPPPPPPGAPPAPTRTVVVPAAPLDPFFLPYGALAHVDVCAVHVHLRAPVTVVCMRGKKNKAAATSRQFG